MQVPHNAMVVVADGRKMLFLRNEGDNVHLNLQVERKRVQDNPDNIDQRTDAPGRTFSRGRGAAPMRRPIFTSWRKTGSRRRRRNCSRSER